MSDSAETMREAIKRFHRNGCYPEALDFEVDALVNELAALSASGTKSDGGVESRHAKTGNMSGAVPEEEQSLPASGFVRAFGPEDKTSKPRDGVAPIPSDPIPSQPDEREAIARIIDPKAHEKFDAAYMAGDWHGRMHWIGSVMKSRETADAILAMQAERRGAKQDIVDLAKDLVALWTSPKISGLPRSERNAAIEDTRNAMIEAVGNLARSSVGSEQGSSNSEVTGSSPVAPATNAAVAQSAEQPFCKGTVSGSSPDGGTNTQPAPIAGLEPVASLLDELREYTALRYAGDCKCGNCQLVPRAAAMSQPSRSTMTERRFARIAFWNGRKVMRMTTPHPTPEEGMTPEERYEALCRVFEHTGHALAGFQADAVMKSIREAEAAGEARGRANSILPNDDLLERCAELLRWYSSGELTGSAIRELANAIAPTLSTHSALRLAENRTHEDAMRFVVSFIRARTDKEPSDD